MKRNPHLDGLRGLAVGMVLLWHYVGCQITPQHTPSLLWLREIVGMMWSGVDLFFVLSGFLITGILRDQRESRHYWGTFYLRRACRILPLYVILVGSYSLANAAGLNKAPGLWWLFYIPMPTWSYATFTQNFYMAAAGGTGANWLGITWSLAVEEQFYLLLPCVVFSSRGAGWRPRWPVACWWRRCSGDFSPATGHWCTCRASSTPSALVACSRCWPATRRNSRGLGRTWENFMGCWACLE